MALLKSAVHITHEYISKIVNEGDICVDATMGAGRDTEFLASLVGDSGKVYAFDIQPAALERTRALLRAKDLENRARLILDGHQNMDGYVKPGIKAAMFNLGYLPGGDHRIGTKAETTIAAIQKAMSLLCAGGLITVAIYYGGDSGFEEKESVMAFLENIDSRAYSVLVHQYVNQPNCPPIAACIEKL